jgi:hypothetical protein
MFRAGNAVREALRPSNSVRNSSENRPKVLSKLKECAAPAQASPRLPVEETRRVIRQLCEGRYFTAADLAQFMNRNPNSLRNRFLTPMVDEGLLERKYSEEPNRPDQAYTTKT